MSDIPIRPLSATGDEDDVRPLFVDNRDGNSMARAIQQHLQALRQDQAMLWGVSIATAFFNVPGFSLIADELEQVGKVQLLLGAEPRPEATPEKRRLGETDAEFIERRMATALQQLDKGLCEQRDLLPFDEQTDGAIRRLLDLLHSGKVEVKRYERNFLHAKAYIFRVAGGGILVGSSNLTYAGLRKNLELNLGHYEDPLVDKVETWFDELWDAAQPYDLAAIYDRLMAEYSPYLIFLRVLYELYGEELGEEQEEVGDIPITNFQKHGVWRALRILKLCGGVLIADGVGLGKTFTAGEIIRRYRENRQRVLLICPAALRDSTWADFLNKYEFDRGVECVSYEELSRDRQLGGEGSHLQNPVDDYALVVIDEAHNYRNPDAPMRAGILRRLLMGQRRAVVMLSATPVNNSLWDLYHLLHYFVKQDAHFADRGVLSIRSRFEDAMQVDPFNLNPDLLYPIIDATTVKRTRRFIKKHYENDLIPGPDGVPIPIRFPKPVASTINYDLEAVLPGFLDEIELALMPPTGSPQLSLARYQPDNYLAGQPAVGADQAIVGLLRSCLLKRFESSVHAFARTTAKMVREHDLFLRGLADGKVIKKELMRELSAADDADEIEELLAVSEHIEDASGYNVDALRAAVEADRNLLDGLCRKAQGVKIGDSPKLAKLAEELVSIAKEAATEGIDEEDQRRKRKVIVFSFFADTVDWIEEYLRDKIDRDAKLAAFRGRIASVVGGDSRRGVSREDAVHGFAPESSGARPAKPGEHQDRFDILICTDVLAEGMNLQQCRNVINYDLPWNPMRLVQRHGRIDRINSRHDQVFLRTFFPDSQLDRLLDLERRVRSKLAQAAASVGVEATPIEHGAEGPQSFSETRDEIEKLHEADSSIYEAGGTEGAAQSGEEYRQELRKALSIRGDEITQLPWKAGSGLTKGKQRGHFFCAKVGDRVYLRFVPFDNGDGSEITKEIGTCLRLIECGEDTERALPLPLKQTAFSAWQEARQDIFDDWTFETDPANLQPKVSKFNRELAAYLRDHPPTGVEQSRLEHALDAIEAPCSRREENALRAVFNASYQSHDARVEAIVAEVKRIGLEPFQAPDPLPAIEIDEVHLICWLAIEPVE